MNKYKIEYWFDGWGEAIVKAKSKKKAEELWENGEFESEKEGGMDYEVGTITEVKENKDKICRHCGKVHKKDTAICN